MEKVVIIVAGGKGLRMGSETPKQFLEINGKAIIIHTIEKFKQVLPTARLVLVLPKDEISRWQDLALKHQLKEVSCVTGGETRFESVKAGLSKVQSASIVAVHDAVRPFVSEATILACMKAAKDHGAAIPVVDLKDSIRKVEKSTSFAVNRSEYKLVQTPQCFKSELLIEAYQQEFKPKFTDDASIVESLGHAITMVKGNDENIKITEPADFKWAQTMLF